MADLNPNDVPPPIVVPNSAVMTQVNAGLRDALLIVSAVPALSAVLGTHDVYKILNFVASESFAPVLGLLVAVGVFGYRQWLTIRNHAEKKDMANDLSDDKAIVK